MKKIILLFLILTTVFIPNVSALSASFVTTERGANIICTSTSTGSITGYKWTVTVNESDVGTTGWVYETAVETYTVTIPSGGYITIQLCVTDGSSEICAQKGLGKISGYKDKYNPSHYKNCKQCEDIGYYWYNDSCHLEPETLPWNEKKILPSAGEHLEHEIEILGYTVDSRILFVFLAVIIIMIIYYIRRNKK